MFNADSRGNHEDVLYGEALSLYGGPNAPASLTIGKDLPCNDIPKIKATLDSDIEHDKAYLPLTRYYGSKRRLIWLDG